MQLKEKINAFIAGSYKEKIEVQKYSDPVFEEGKKEEKKVDKKNLKAVQEEKVEEQLPDYSLELSGQRKVLTFAIRSNIQ